MRQLVLESRELLHCLSLVGHSSIPLAPSTIAIEFVGAGIIFWFPSQSSVSWISIVVPRVVLFPPLRVFWHTAAPHREKDEASALHDIRLGFVFITSKTSRHRNGGVIIKRRWLVTGID